MSNPHLHSDVMYQILLHLPVKALCKFRYVSKSWYALISDPIFHRSYRELPIKDRRRILLIPIPAVEDRRRIVLISNYSTRCPAVDMDGNLGFKDCKSRRSLWSPPFACLDLVCFDDSRGIHLWNPATAEHAEIVLGDSSTILGFGYLPSAKEYKILGIVGKDGATVFTFGEGGMRRRIVNPPPSFPLHILCGEHATVNGMIYLMSTTTLISADLVIVQFDLERDEWSLLDGPPEFPEGKFWKSCRGNLSGRSSLRNLSGSLCLLRFSDCGRQLMCILKDGVWMKYNIDISMLVKPWVRGFHGLFPPVVPLDIMEDGRLLLFTELFSRLLYYDPKRCKVLEEIFHAARAELSVEMKQFHPPLLYTEGLTSPIRISRSDDK